jgi:hypothetical protein
MQGVERRIRVDGAESARTARRGAYLARVSHSASAADCRRVEQQMTEVSRMKDVQTTELELTNIEELEGKIAPDSSSGFLE